MGIKELWVIILEMSYHIRIEFGRNTGDCRINITEDELINQIVAPYLNAENIMNNGKVVQHENIVSIKIVEGVIEGILKAIKEKDEYADILELALNQSPEWRAIDIMTDVTNKYLTRPPIKKEATALKAEIAEHVIIRYYVALNRIEELKSVNKKLWNLSKLIRLCEELNDNWQSSNFFSVIALLRTILHHVPPIFGFRNFEEVANNYSGGRSFKRVMKRLFDLSKNIGDLHLHGQVQKKDALPNDRQVDFSNDLDLLLCEIIKLNN